MLPADPDELKSTAGRFWSHVSIPRSRIRLDKCWVWTGAKHKGYGQFTLRWFKNTEGKWRCQTVRAHRFAYELIEGPIPEGLTIEHECQNKACIRPGPGHCIPMTRGENSRRGNTRTICKAGLHEMTGNNVIRRPSRPATSGECRACANARRRESSE